MDLKEANEVRWLFNNEPSDTASDSRPEIEWVKRRDAFLATLPIEQPALPQKWPIKQYLYGFLFYVAAGLVMFIGKCIGIWPLTLIGFAWCFAPAVGVLAFTAAALLIYGACWILVPKHQLELLQKLKSICK